MSLDKSEKLDQAKCIMIFAYQVKLTQTLDWENILYWYSETITGHSRSYQETAVFTGCCYRWGLNPSINSYLVFSRLWGTAGEGLVFLDFCLQLIRKQPAKYLIFTSCAAEMPEASEESSPVLTPLMPQHMADRRVDALLPSLGKGQTIPVCGVGGDSAICYDSLW